tara:strand:- start:14179 stop:14556 length:378 start_codon:yes stop_codon:yes gene_type:complete
MSLNFLKELNPMLRNLLNDEAGFLVSAELVLIFTLVFCAVAVGVSTVRDSLVQELGDVAEAVGALNQSYNYRGISAAADGGVNHASCSGSGFNDENDDCDCKGIAFTTVCGKNDPSTSNNPEGTL